MKLVILTKMYTQLQLVSKATIKVIILMIITIELPWQIENNEYLLFNNSQMFQKSELITRDPSGPGFFLKLKNNVLFIGFSIMK